MKIDFNCITKAAWNWWRDNHNYKGRYLTIEEMKTMTETIRNEIATIVSKPLQHSADIVLLIRLALALAYLNKINMNRWVVIDGFEKMTNKSASNN